MQREDERLPPGDAGGLGSGAGGGGRLYNPYADLYPTLDPKSLDNLSGSLYQLPSAPEYLFTEEATVHRRSFGDNLTFYTGMGYLLGASAGGVRGLVEGVRSQETGDTLKLRVSRLLNATGHRGRSAGNALGILGLLYGGLEGAACHYRKSDDLGNAVFAGLATGALYKCAAGPRSAAIAGAVGGLTAAGMAAVRQLSKRHLAF